MSLGKHVEHRGGLRRKVIGVPLVVWLIVVALAGTAIALFLVRGGMQGSVTGASYQISLWSVNNGSATNCTVTQSGNNINVAWTGAVEDDDCPVYAAYAAPASNSGHLRLQGITVPAGLGVTEINGPLCGKTFAPDSQGPEGDVQVMLTFDGAQPNATFDPNLHGFEFVRAAEFDPLLCGSLTVAP